jgi:hypothetical protein
MRRRTIDFETRREIAKNVGKLVKRDIVSSLERAEKRETLFGEKYDL